MFKKFLEKYGLSAYNVAFIPYGSRVYGTHSENSDYDFLAVVNKKGLITGEEFTDNNTQIQIYQEEDFQKQLNMHKIHALEAYYLPEDIYDQYEKFSYAGLKIPRFNLDIIQLRHSLSEKASHSFVKAKKKIEVEKDYYVGWKSLFHALRILTFGIRIAKENRIIYNEANYLWEEIKTAQQYNWQYFKEKYQPIMNELSTEFKKVAPKF